MARLGQYYRHSGGVGPMGPILMVLLGALGAVLGGAVYGYAVYYIPFVYINFFITLIFGALVGYAVGLGAKWGKVRNPALLAIGGLAFGGVAVYAGWVSWILAVSEQQNLLLMPGHIWSVAQLVAATGAWSIFSWTPQGGSLYAIWSIEAFMIVGTASMTTWGLLATTPFCEKCNAWVEGSQTIGPLEALNDTGSFKSHLEQGNFAELMTLKQAAEGSEAATLISVLTCPGCNQQHFLKAEAVTTKVENGKQKTESSTIFENLVIDADTYSQLKANRA